MLVRPGPFSFRIGLAVLIQYRSVTDTQPATQPRCRSYRYYAQRSGVEPKKHPVLCLSTITFDVLMTCETVALRSLDSDVS